MLSEYGANRVTVEVQLADGTKISNTQHFNSGNPRYHASETQEAGVVALGKIDMAVSAIYGDIRKDRT